MSRRGMTLIEVLTAATMSIVVIAGLTGATLNLQTISLRQQQRLLAQESLRAAGDLLALDLRRAGTGVGAARVSLGDTTSTSALAVTTGATFSSDPDFEAPAGDLAAMISDGLVVYSGRTATALATACCPGQAGMNGCGTCRVREGNHTCMATDATGFAMSQPVVFVNATLGVACAHEVSAAPSSNQLVTREGVGTHGAPDPSDPCGDNGQAWCSASTWALQLDSVAYRVNWKPVVAGTAQRPRLQQDPDGPLGPDGWHDVLWDVERLQVRLMVDDLTAPGTFRFFPDATAGRPGLDECTAATCTVPGGTDARDATLALGVSPDEAVRRQLQRRVRGVEVTLLSRTMTADPGLVRRDHHGFELDDEGLPRDGYQRRRLVFLVTPRNFGLTEAP